MSIYSDRFSAKTQLIRDKLFSKSRFFSGKGAAFISVCGGESRAAVLRASASSPEKAFDEAAKKAARYVNTNGIEPKWIKVDLTDNAEVITMAELKSRVIRSRNEFFRKGICFDESWERPLCEAEINGNKVISYKKHDIELKVVNSYLQKNSMPVMMNLPEKVIIYDTVSFFCDEKGDVFELYGSGNNCGRRITGDVTKEKALEVITTATDYLTRQIYPVGAFDYGIYPTYHKVIPGYNILRHASTIWSIICRYRLTGDTELKDLITSAIGFMIKNMANRYDLPPEEINTVFLIDRQANEIKLGGNAMAIIALTEYMDAFGNDRYKKLCIELGNGILQLHDSATGKFTHVLDYLTLAVKERFRTVYYDGEAVFALMRLYGLTKDEKWLSAARRSIDMFIREKYEKYRDHWAAYALNEFTKYVPEKKYYDFAMRNAALNLNKIYNQDTTYHTYLELLGVTFETWLRLKRDGTDAEYSSLEDAKKLADTIFHRADYMLNGYFYPEYAMYMKYPDKILGSFFIRHDGYRIRIDDVQHFVGAYYSFYRNYDELIKLRSSEEK
ncbi:MAG: hypothetical protein ACI4JJ_04920 [Huintestinicola sp.]